jgi:hypothetical protein
MTATSFRPLTNLPSGKTLYARLWTLNNGIWADAPDVTFTAEPTLTNPVEGAQDVDTSNPFTWSGDPQATSYRLTVGTSQGGGNLADSGEISGTSYGVPGLPAGQTLWARLTVKYGSVTTTDDVSFTARVRTARLTSPTAGSSVYADKPLTWNAVSGADSYWLEVGTSPGASDLIDSGPITSTSYDPPTLPVGTTLYARLWTISNGIYAQAPDVSFTSVVPPATITSPTDGQLDFDTSEAFTWTTVPQADSYWIWIGTAGGQKDVVSKRVSGTSFVASGLPAGQTLWVRVYTLGGGRQTPSADVQFTTAAGSAAASSKQISAASSNWKSIAPD